MQECAGGTLQRGAAFSMCDDMYTLVCVLKAGFCSALIIEVADALLQRPRAIHTQLARLGCSMRTFLTPPPFRSPLRLKRLRSKLSLSTVQVPVSLRQFLCKCPRVDRSLKLDQAEKWFDHVEKQDVSSWTCCNEQSCINDVPIWRLAVTADPELSAQPAPTPNS